jgi:hypothetical protein
MVQRDQRRASVQASLLLGEATFLGLILELQSDQGGFQEAQKENCKDRRENAPEHHMHPPGDAKFKLGDQRAADA